MTKIQVLILAPNKHSSVPRAIRHYESFADRITVYDLPIHGPVSDHIKSTGWINDHQSDWVIAVDADELVHFPLGVQETLAKYDEQNAPLITAKGFSVKGGVEIYTPKYSKPAIFSPRRIMNISFSRNGEECTAIDLNLHVVRTPEESTEPPAILLRYI